MGKKRLALLLALVMLLSLLPVSALAEEPVNEPVVEQGPGPTQGSAPNPTILALNNAMAEGAVTPEDVHAALDQAAENIENAGSNFTPGSVPWWEEAGAAANIGYAAGHLSAAENATNFSDAVTNMAANYGENQAQNAADAAAAAGANADTADAQAHSAAGALQDAKDATNKQDAVNAADAAQNAAVAAQQAAAAAIAAAEEAAQNAVNAQDAYETAAMTYALAKEEADRQLALGLIDAMQAEALTADAARRANEAYNDMLTAQAAAEAAYEQAQAAAEEADAILQEKLDALENAITENAKNVAEKTGVAALTGAALAAAKIAAEVVDLEVGYYELRIDATQAELDEVQARVDEAQKAIDEAQAVVDAKKAALDQADDDYDEAVAELQQAEADLKAAQDVVDNLQAILEARGAAEQAGVTDAFDKVASGEASAADRKTVTEYVLGSASQYDQNATDLTVKEWVTDDVFTIEDGEGNVTYYQVQTVEEKDGEGTVTNRYLQFVQVEPKDEETVDSLPDGKTTFNNAAGTGNTRTTDLVARDAAGNEYPVKIKKTTFIVTWYDFQVDGKNLDHDDGGYYFGSGSAKTYVTIVQPLSETVYEQTEGGLGGSNAVSGMWAAADSADENLTAKALAAQKAGEDVQAAYGAQQQAVNAYMAADAVLQDLVDDQQADKEKVEQLKEELKELDKKLNGSFAEQLTVAFLDNGLDGVNDKIEQSIGVILDEETQQKYDEIQANIASLQEQLETATGIKRALLIAAIAEQNLEAAAITGRVLANADIDLEEIQEQGSAIAEVLSAFSDGETNLDDATAVANLLLNGGLSAKTQEFIIDKIVEALTVVHENAVEALQEAVEEGIQEIATATGEAADAALTALEAQALVTVTETAKALADALTEDAAAKKEAADEAAAAAKEAREEYEALLNSYGPTDENVIRAQEAAEEAQKAAEEAQEAAERAQEAADRAQKDYLEARKIADEFPEYDSYWLGMTIAQFARSLAGTVYAQRVGYDPDKMRSEAFVRYVYGAFGIDVDLTVPTVDNANRRPGDLLVKTGGGFGVVYDESCFVEYSEVTGQVEVTPTEDVGDSYSVIRLV